VIKNPKNDTASTEDTHEGIKQGRDILYLIFNIMSLAVRHTYPLKCWRIVWMIFIEKKIGNPSIERL